ncbi:MAG: SIMPL domain-containing protein [Candidatus Paceibacterota bacterium]|jgi:hypothetical protein
MDNTNKTFIVSASILGGAFIIASLIAALTFYQIRMGDNTITVTGSAKQSVTADRGKWIAVITRPVAASNIKAGHASLEADTKAAISFLSSHGLAESDYTISPVFMNEDWSANQNNTGDKRYNLTETITVLSEDVAKITTIAKASASLAASGVLISTQSLEYLYSNLPELRVSLLSAAVTDAKARAEELAKSGGSSIGKLRGASSGVVQVLSPNSVDVADYGSYDTSSVEKDVMITVKATFALR